MRSRNVPEPPRATSQLNSAVRAFPRWSEPVGEGRPERAEVAREVCARPERRQIENAYIRKRQGRLASQAPEIDGICYINDDNGQPLRAGEFRTIRITEAHDYDLVGEIIDAPERYTPPAAEMFPILASIR